MTVAAEKLIRMAEQVAANISTSPDEDVVAAKVAEHLQKFWDPRMRAEILRRVEAEPSAVSPMLSQALRKL